MGQEPCVFPTFDSSSEIPSKAESIFNALSPELKEGCQTNPKRVALQTPTRKLILEALLENVTCPSFEPTTNILIGAKGIGKTRVLRQLQSIGNQLDGNLGIAYADLSQQPSTISSVLPSRLLEKIVIDKLGSTVEHQKSDPNPVLPALASLKRLGKRVVLLYDETESLYMKNSPERVRFLEDLQVLANTGYDNCYVLLCGSSSVLPGLISDSIPASLRNKFPLRTIDLNGTKFLPIRISPAPVVEDSKAAVEVYLSHLTPEKQLEIARLLSFFGGSSMRLLCPLLSGLRPGGTRTAESVLDTLTSNLLSDSPFVSSSAKSQHDQDDLLHAIYKEMATANNYIFEMTNVKEPSELMKVITSNDFPLHPVDLWKFDAPLDEIRMLVNKGFFCEYSVRGLIPRSPGQVLTFPRAQEGSKLLSWFYWLPGALGPLFSDILKEGGKELVKGVAKGGGFV